MQRRETEFQPIPYRLLLGNRVYSGWSMRAWLVLKLSGADFETEVIPLYTDAFEAYRRIYRPARQLPALIIGSGPDRRVVWDSLAITEYIAEQFPDTGIWPMEVEERAAARSLCAEMHSGFRALRISMPFNSRRRYLSFRPPDEIKDEIRRLCELWEWVLSSFGSDEPYLFGSRFTAADAFFAPVMCRFHTYGIELEDRPRDYAEAILGYPDVREFLDASRSEPWLMAHNELDID